MRTKTTKLLQIFIVFSSFMVMVSCRETVPPETLEDETTEQDSVEVDLGNYDDEP